MAVLRGGRKVVAATTAAEPLSATSASIRGQVVVQALATNTTLIAVGGSDVESAVGSEKGTLLAAGAITVVEDADELGDIYVDVRTNGEGVSYRYATSS